ncbi:hypothetical protein [Deinococcus cellulosilyticus]|uniref:hypothetical protein n=1 Tax=Deinococcus cellulosilyticus TaxID=401558 RepID=UPI0011BED8DA|nr:hypothetical protein [Deinococcus cellulosilyticus]
MRPRSVATSAAVPPAAAPSSPAPAPVTGLDPLTLALVNEAPIVPDALQPAAPPSDTTHQNLPSTSPVDSGDSKVSIFAVLGGFCAVGLLTALALFSGRQPGRSGRPAPSTAVPVAPRNLKLNPPADPLAGWTVPGAQNG